MSYLVLARKYRPQVFEDIVGQEHLTRTLANAISSGRVAHAYLFCGPRGVGKTTAARILAKALNCETGPTPVPCNTCPVCREITEGRSMDVLEIDGASNRGINEVRELRENVRYAPTGERSKVYIIDEVHMLTTEAFNALLKTLEEPPAHVVFVFATTEPFKVPPTILSRVQRFDFARIPARKIAAHLETIITQEGLKASPEALSLIARRARGGLRDALSLMDQLISSAEETIERETVERLLGLVGGEVYYDLVAAIAGEDAGGALGKLDEVYTRGADLGDLAEGLTTHLRDLLLVRISPGLTALLEAPESELPRLTEQAEQFSREALVDMVDRAADLASDIRRSEHPRLTMELALAEMAHYASRVPIGDLAKRLLDLESRLGGAGPGPGPAERKTSPPARPRETGASPASSRRVESAKPAGPAATPAKATAEVPGSGKAQALWSECVEASRTRGMAFYGMMQAATAIEITVDAQLVVRSPNAMVKQAIGDAETARFLGEVLEGLGLTGGRVVLEGATVPETPAPAPETPAPEAKGSPPPAPEAQAKPSVKPDAPDAKTPSDPAARTAPEAAAEPDTRSMGQIFKDEPILQKALDMFDGEVLP